MVTLASRARIVSRQDIDCPGDTIQYACSVQSNSETVQLRWRVMFPGQAAITILYSNDSNLNATTYLPMNVSTILTHYQADRRIESELELTVLRNVSMNGTIIECASEDLDNATLIVNVSTSGKSSRLFPKDHL